MIGKLLTEEHYKIMYYRQAIKDLVLRLKAKIPLLKFITQHYSSNELFDFFPLALLRLTEELPKFPKHVSKD